MTKEDLKNWVERYNSDIVEGKFVCFFCKTQTEKKKMLYFSLVVDSETILGCSVCIKEGGMNVFF